MVQAAAALNDMILAMPCVAVRPMHQLLLAQRLAMMIRCVITYICAILGLTNTHQTFNSSL